MSNNLYSNQNKNEMQKLIVCQHYIYIRAKKISLLALIITSIVPLAFNITMLFIDNATVISVFSFISISILLINLVLKWKIFTIKEHAAMVQQAFDREVYGLEKYFIIDENIVALEREKYKNKDWERKKNWYPNYEKLDKNKAIFYCQKENISWTQELSKRYSYFLYTVLLLSIFVSILNFILVDISFIRAVGVIVVFIPVLSYFLDTIFQLRKDYKNSITLQEHANSIEKSLNTNEEPLIDIITLQLMIYETRKNNFLIPEWFEKKNYKELESVEQRKAKNRRKNKCGDR